MGSIIPSLPHGYRTTTSMFCNLGTTRSRLVWLGYRRAYNTDRRGAPGGRTLSMTWNN